MPQPQPPAIVAEPPIVLSDEARRMIVSLSARGVVATVACLGDHESVECRDAKADEDREMADLFRYVSGLEADLAKLSDPAAVYVNMLRGTVARPSIESIVRLYGADALRGALPGGRES